jgi:hypothetical protein
MLMHVSPSEVEGLKALGAMTGRRVTTNPHTGMPEAFDFGDFFTSLIPTGIGFLLGGPAAATAIGSALGPTAAAAAPVVGGMAAGALVAGAKGDDPLLGGVMGGLGGYGGSNLASSFSNMVNPATAASSNINIANATGQGIKNIGSVQPGVQLAKDVGINAPLASDQFATSLTPNLPSTNVIAGQPVSTVASGAKPGDIGTNISNAGEVLGRFAKDPMAAYKQFTDAGGSAMQLATPLAMAGLAGAQEDLYPEADKSEEEKRKAEENKYKDPRTGLLNLAQASPGLKLMATGGTVGTNQSTINTGGIQDLYGTNDQTTGNQQLSKDGYGIGRLENLASAGSRAKAADTFYAMGGPIAFAKGGHQGYLDGAGDGMSDSIPATIEGQQPARLADGEFVIPADVVSHIGNGSSKAGSKRLYAMLDRVRKARTGHTKQGKEINPNKYMPA